MAVKRRYESAHRQAQAEQTRQAILDAAATLFVEPGYAATPLTAIATEAGVAIQTVYKVFGNKQSILSTLVDVTVAGDDEPVAMPHRQFVAEIRALTGARAKLDRYARHLIEVHARQAQVMLALANAATADTEAAEIWRKNLDDRRNGMTGFATDLLATGELKPEHTVETATDVLWLAMDVRNYDWLVRQRAWPTAHFHRWYVDTVAAALLTPPPASASKPQRAL